MNTDSKLKISGKIATIFVVMVQSMISCVN